MKLKKMILFTFRIIMLGLSEIFNITLNVFGIFVFVLFLYE